MNLHYSQTEIPITRLISQSYTSMNLHYSQTTLLDVAKSLGVLYLYEFTLLSNHIAVMSVEAMVLYLYEFTLLSNTSCLNCCLYSVLYLYEFTLLSNLLSYLSVIFGVLYLYEFTLLSNESTVRLVRIRSYTSMNLHYSQTMSVMWNCQGGLIPL